MIRAYPSHTLNLICKHLTERLPEDGESVDFPFDLENFCLDLDIERRDLLVALKDLLNDLLKKPSYNREFTWRATQLLAKYGISLSP